jgi:hypothetical protein
MDIKSLNQQIRKDPDQNYLYNFFKQTTRGGVTDDSFREHVVGPDDEMRIDLIMQKIYDLSPTETMNYYEQIDVLLAINNIDNPINIPQGTIIKYPPEVGLLDALRILTDDDKTNPNSVRDKMAKKITVPNKTTRKDKARTDFMKNGMALPPTLLDNPKAPVRLTDSKFSVGGL